LQVDYTLHRGVGFLAGLVLAAPPTGATIGAVIRCADAAALAPEPSPLAPSDPYVSGSNCGAMSAPLTIALRPARPQRQLGSSRLAFQFTIRHHRPAT
jgi:hypothetical protein